MYDDYEVTVGLPCVPKQDKTRSIYRWLEDLPDSPRKYFVIGMDPWKSPVRFEDQYDYAVNGPGSSGGFYSGHYSDYYQNICDGYGWSYESCERGSSVEYILMLGI
ncbi:hypothetical protein SEUCBS139899_001204 [Sporothrix eucalyptigena]